jgi:hypothetical protein
MSAPICFVDTETDGVHPGRLPWEIALIRRHEDGQQHEISFFVEIDLSTADVYGLKIGGFYERHPVGRAITLSGHPQNWNATTPDRGDYFTRARAAQLVARMTHGAHVVGAVPNFDTHVLDPLLRENGLVPSWHYHLVDVESLAVGYAAAKGIEISLPWKSDDLSTAIGVFPPGEADRHTALGDARWARRLYDAVTGNAVVLTDALVSPDGASL